MNVHDTMRRLAGHPFAGIVAAGAVLTAILGYLVVDRVLLISRGREVVLAIRPVDPRDLFKGDYVRLAYDISNLPTTVISKEVEAEWRARLGLSRRPIYVILEQQQDGNWQPVAASMDRPDALPPNRVAIRGRALNSDPRRLRYGIERYYVPEGTGGRLENLARETKLSVIVAVDTSGTAAIKGLVADGKRIYDEPLL
ncbi:MAG: GDYXXLXY domain-containing protein [Hyphomicrobiaceae bacterium]